MIERRLGYLYPIFPSDAAKFLEASEILARKAEWQMSHSNSDDLLLIQNEFSTLSRVEYLRSKCKREFDAPCLFSKRRRGNEFAAIDWNIHSYGSRIHSEVESNVFHSCDSEWRCFRCRRASSD